jgi:hypothetical protein
MKDRLIRTASKFRAFRIVGLASLLLALPGAALAEDRHGFGSRDHAAVDVSMIALIAHPDAYEGKVVVVNGVLSFDDEGDVVCFNLESARHGMSKNCLAIEWDLDALRTKREVLRERHLKPVVISGRFSEEFQGIWSLAAGGLEKVGFLVDNLIDDSSPEAPAP